MGTFRLYISLKQQMIVISSKYDSSITLKDDVSKTSFVDSNPGLFRIEDNQRWAKLLWKVLKRYITALML